MGGDGSLHPVRTPSLPREALTRASTPPSTMCGRAPVSALEGPLTPRPLNEPPFTGSRRPRAPFWSRFMSRLWSRWKASGRALETQAVSYLMGGWKGGPGSGLGRKLLVDGFTTTMTSPPGARVPVCPSGTDLSSRTLRLLSGLLAGHRRHIGFRWRRLTCGRHALLVLAHRQCDDIYACLAAAFRVGLATVREAVDLGRRPSPPAPAPCPVRSGGPS